MGIPRPVCRNIHQKLHVESLQDSSEIHIQITLDNTKLHMYETVRAFRTSLSYSVAIMRKYPKQIEKKRNLRNLQVQRLPYMKPQNEADTH